MPAAEMISSVTIVSVMVVYPDIDVVAPVSGHIEIILVAWVSAVIDPDPVVTDNHSRNQKRSDTPVDAIDPDLAARPAAAYPD